MFRIDLGGIQFADAIHLPAGDMTLATAMGGFAVVFPKDISEQPD